MDGMRHTTEAASVVYERPTRDPFSMASSAPMLPALGAATRARLRTRRAPAQVTFWSGLGSAPP